MHNLQRTMSSSPTPILIDTGTGACLRLEGALLVLLLVDNLY